MSTLPFFSCEILFLALLGSLVAPAQLPINLPGNEQRVTFLADDKDDLMVLMHTLREQEYSRSKNPDAALPLDLWPNAINALNEAIALPDYHGLSKQMLNAAAGYALFMEGRFKEAAAAYRKSLHVWRNSPPVSYNLVLSDIKLAALDDARKDLQGIQAGGDLTLLNGLIDNAAAAAKLSAHAAELFRQDEYAGAAADYAAAAKLQPENGRLLAMEGLCLSQRGEYDHAVKIFNLAVQLSSPQDPLPHVGLSQAECHRKRWDNADGEYALALDIDPKNLETRMSHVECLKLRGNWIEEEAALKDALKLGPDDPEVLNSYGYELALRGERLPEALSMIQRAVAASPTNGNYLDSLAWAQFKSGQLAEAMQTIQAASHDKPKNLTILDHYGDIAVANHDAKSANAAWSAVLKTATDPELKMRVHKKLRCSWAAQSRRQGRKIGPAAPGRTSASAILASHAIVSPGE